MERSGLGGVPPRSLSSRAQRRLYRAWEGWNAPSLANYSLTLPQASWVALDRENLRWVLEGCSGAPVELGLQLFVNTPGSTGWSYFSLAWDGVEVTGTVAGMVRHDIAGANIVHARFTVAEPAPGDHVVSVVWSGGGTGTVTVYADKANFRCRVWAEEK